LRDLCACGSVRYPGPSGLKIRKKAGAFGKFWSEARKLDLFQDQANKYNNIISEFMENNSL
jgi:hypothetical protein